MRILQHRKLTLINTDAQRRCYDGRHFSSKLIWTAWSGLEIIRSETHQEERLTYWRGLNNYAASQRGKSAKSEFQVVEKETYE